MTGAAARRRRAQPPGLRPVSNLPTALPESAFQRTIIDTAILLGWRVVHIRAQRVDDDRWAVPYEGHAGLPDLILARAGVVLLVELKSAKGVLTPEQRAWLEEAGEFGLVWRPADWPAAYAILRDGVAA